jgi:hypothetical protein
MSVMAMMPYGLLTVFHSALADAGFQWSGHGVIVLLDVMVVNHQQTLSPLRLFLSLTLIQPSQENVILKGTLDHLEESQIFGSGGTLLLSSLKHWKKLQRLWKVLIPQCFWTG